MMDKRPKLGPWEPASWTDSAMTSNFVDDPYCGISYSLRGNGWELIGPHHTKRGPESGDEGKAAAIAAAISVGWDVSALTGEGDGCPECAALRARVDALEAQLREVTRG